MSRSTARSSLLAALFLSLAFAGPALAQGGPPDTIPPDFSKGKGVGKSGANVSFSCLGIESASSDRGSPLAYIEDELVLQQADSVVVVAGGASGDLSEGLQSANASVETSGLSLQPFDVCASSAGSALDSVVVGSHSVDPTASGIADVEFHVSVHATLELEQSSDSDAFVAYSGTELEVLGLSLGYFRVSAEAGGVSAPPGLSITETVEGDLVRYDITGTYVIEGQLLYGPETTNVVKTSFTAGGEIEGVEVDGATVAAGFAGAQALDSVLYDIVSLDPEVEFTFVGSSE